MAQSPFMQVTVELNGDGCACHTGIGFRTMCKHCWPWIDEVRADTSAHALDCRCERCRPDILRLAVM